MRRFLPILLAFAILFGAPPLQADSGLVPHKAEYKVKISLLTGRLNTELRRTDTGYIATHLIEATGVAGALVNGEIFAASEFAFDDDGIVPLRYRGNDEISNERLVVDIAFDWEAHRATGQFKTRDDPAPVEVDEPLKGRVHDAVSIQYQLMAGLANGGSPGEYVLFEHDRVRKLQVTRIGTQEISTKAGTFNAVGIRHQAENSSRSTTMWLAEELGFLPVMIERFRKGKLQMRAKLESYEPITG